VPADGEHVGAVALVVAFGTGMALTLTGGGAQGRALHHRADARLDAPAPLRPAA
jgi:hypothetical protein